MPGLYKTKRKRLTLNSSQLNNTSIWHSTPVQDDSTADEGEVGELDEPDLLESMILSPSKRPTLGQGLVGSSAPSQTPAAVATVLGLADSDSEEELFIGTGTKNENLNDGSELSLHQSSRFGPVIINPPSGHTYFASILHKNGFILSQPKNHLRVDALVFRKNMEDWLKSNNDENSRIENDTSKFLKAVNNYFMGNENLRHSFTTTMNDTEYLQPSLLHCLLGVPFLQPHVLKVILPLIAEASYSNTQEDSDLVATIMTQMKWLPTLVDGKSLASGLMDILENGTAASRKQMIRLLPEVFMPEFHPEIIPKLLEIFDGGTQINVTMLDCFASLEIPETVCIDIRHRAVNQMAAAPLVELPAYFAFLFRLGSSSHLQEGINEMREKVEIKSKGNDPKNVAYQCEILERIRFCVSVNCSIMKMWISKIKDDLSCGIDLKTLDLIMLLVFAESADKSAMAALRLLFDTKGLVCKLFDKLMEHNKQMVVELFPTLAKFLDSVLRMKDAKCHDAASEITWKLFVGLGPVKSQHLTSNLVGVIINGHPNCRDVALQIFTKIAQTDPLKLLFFHHYLMGALHYVIKFPPRQMQALMNVLAILANVPENVQGQTNTFTIEFMILLRKQLTDTNLQKRCFGVLGTLAAVRQLAIHPPADEEKINELLQLAWSSTERDEEACSIFFDELATCVRILPKEVCLKFRDILKTKFETTWTVDQASESQVLRSSCGQAGLELSLTFDANKEVQQDVLVIILEPKVLEMSPLVIPSHLRVMVELEKVVENGALEGVDVVIGCPVFFPKLTKYYELEDLDDFSFNKRLYLGQYLALVTNYFRECVSAFVESDNPELRLKVWLRFNNIITLQKIWVKHLQSFPNLPSAYGAEKSMSSNSTGAGFSGGPFQPADAAIKKKPKTGTTKRKLKKMKKTKKQKNEEDNDDEEENEEDDEEVQTIILHIDLEEMIQSKQLKPYLRRLDSEVFNLLKFPLNLKKEQVDFSGIMLNISTATQPGSTMDAVEQFNAETLSFLLIEIKQQVADKKRRLNVLSISDLLQSVCKHIDVIAAHDKQDPTQQPQIDSCLRLLIGAMTLYFDGIANLDDTDRQASLIESSVMTLAARFKSSSQDIDEELQTQREAIDSASKYIGSFCSFIDSEDPLAAFEHVKLLKTIHDVLPRPDAFKLVIDETVKVYLRRSWKIPAAVIDYLLKTWLAVTPQLIKTLLALSNELIPVIGKPTAIKDKLEPIPNCSRYKSCSKLNFHTWYAALFASLAQHVHKLGRRRGDFDDSYQFWKETIDLFKTFVLLSQRIQKPNILAPLLKHSRVYIEAFISGGVCLLPEVWRSDSTDGQVFIKTLQASTRRIQMICEHSKVMKDNSLMRYVPQIKKVLETLVFRVRESLANYGAASAFWMGALKHKDLDGKEMSSQPFKRTELNTSESDEDDPSEAVDSESVHEELDENAEMNNESEADEDDLFNEDSD